MSEFYVGYAERAPAGVSRFVRGAVIVVLLTTVGLAAALPAAQSAFVASNFEFGTLREFVGWIREKPYPQLLVPTPGSGPGGHNLTVFSLVGEGKHGAAEEVAGFDGTQVRLRGTLIYVEDQTMVEVAAGSVSAIDNSADAKADGPAVRRESLGKHTLEGEIVDSKCYFGVMNPATGKVHRSCAIRCISGGTPPILLVRDGRGGTSHLLLVDEEGRTVNDAVLDLVAEPVRITGEVVRDENLLILRADPETYERVH